MAAVIHLDTHVVAWLYAGRRDLLSPVAAERIDAESLAISPMVVLELEYLFEIGRVTVPAEAVVDDLADRIGLTIRDTRFDRVIAHARRQSWTRDPFDRLIVGHAVTEEAPLVTRDEAIRDHYPGAVW